MSASLATRATKWKKMMNTSPATHCFRSHQVSPGLLLLQHLFHSHQVSSGLLLLHQHETNLKCLAVAVGAIVGSAARRGSNVRGQLRTAGYSCVFFRNTKLSHIFSYLAR